MKAQSAFPIRGRRRLRDGVLVFVLMLPCGCAKEDEELQRQLVETRAALAAKTRELEQAESRPVTTPSPPAAPATSPELTGELANARARIADLESQLYVSKQQTPVVPAPAPRKLDLDALKDKLESDLTNKAKSLREVLVKQAGVARIDEIGIRGIEYPPEIIAPFRSAITFALSASDGRQLRLVFPVTADLDGYWSLPGPDKVQQAYKQVKDAPPMEPGNPAIAPEENTRPQEVATKSGGGPGPAPQAPPSGFRQVDPNTFQFDWGDGAKSRTGSAAAPAPTPNPAAPPNSPTVSAAQPSRPAAAPSAPAQPEMTIPKPVMPVQRDIIIKF